MLAVKQGVRPRGVSPEIIIAVMVASNVFHDAGLDCVITSITDGEHKPASLHNAGYAVDLRADAASMTGLTLRIKERLPAGFDVVSESDHIHIEYDPGNGRE